VITVETDRELDGRLRIGELSRRVGVSAELLRAWERRYGLLSPTRTPGGFRLYGEADERRVRRMLAHLERGVSAAESARLALLDADEDETRESGAPPLNGLVARLRETLDAFDEPGAQAAIDGLLSTFTLDTVLRDAVLPYLHDLGERWERGEASVAQEHFASAVLRGRLLGLARGWGSSGARRVLLACVPGDPHDLGLISFGLALRARGWRVTFLGADMPLATIEETARALAVELVVVSATDAAQVNALREGISALAGAAPLALAGAGADAEVAGAVGARYLDGDPVAAAAVVTDAAAAR
jgi:DNA-binding transcriptional MerR regulator